MIWPDEPSTRVEPAPSPAFDIVIGAAAADTSVKVNGVDTTRALNGVSIASRAGALTQVVLLVRPGHARATVQGAIDSVLVLEEPGSPNASAAPQNTLPTDDHGLPIQGQCQTIPSSTLTGRGSDFNRDFPHPKNEVFCRPDCIWHYCPDPDGCRDACAHPTSVV